MAEEATGKPLNAKELFFNFTTEMACIAGFDGYFKELNPVWSRVLGWSTEELLSRPWNDFVHPDDIDATNSVAATIVDGEEVYTFENRFICKDGTVKWLSWNSRPYPEEGIMFGVARDITHRKRADELLQKSKNRSRAFLDVSRKLVEAEYQENIMQTIVDNALDAMGFATGAIYILSEDRQSVLLKATTPPLPGDFPKGLQIAGLNDHPHIKKVIQTGKYVIIPGTKKVKLTKQEENIVRLRDIRSNLYLPIIFSDQVTGVLIISSMSETYTFEDEEIDLMQGFADQVAHIIKNTQNYRQLESKTEELKKEIANRREAEKALRESEFLLNEAQKITKLGSWNFDFRSDVLTWSEGLYDVFDVDRDTFKETHGSFLSLIDEDDRERAQQVSRHTQKTGEPFHIIYGITTPKGEPRQIEEYGFAEKNDLGNIVRLYGTAQDVTERLKIQEQMLNSDRIFRYASDMLCIVGYDGFFKVVNPAWTDILGWSEEELLSKPYIEFVHPDDLVLTNQEGEKVVKGEGSLDFENRYLCKDGSYRWLSWKSFPFITEQKVYAVVRDITSQKEIEQGLVRLSTAVIQNPASIVITDLDGKIDYVNPAFTDLTGYTAEEARGENPRILKSGRQSSEFYKNLWNTISSGNVWRGELHNRKKNGELYWERATIAPVKDKEGEIINYLAIKEDITRQKETEQEIIESEQKFKIVSENTYHWEFWEREDGSFIYNSPSCERITGYSVTEFEDPDLLIQIIHPNDQEQYKEHRQKTWEDCPDPYSFRIYHKNGDLRYIEQVCHPVYNERGDCIGVRGTNIDVTKRKNIEKRLIESEKRFREIFETLPVISVQGYDSNRNVIYWNKASEDLYGYSRDEAIGQKLEDLIIPDDMRDKVVIDIQNWVDNNIPVPSSELILQKKDGSKVHVYSNHILLKNMNGEPEMFCIDIDLTDLKQNELKLRESEERYRSIIAVSNTGAYEYNIANDELWVSSEYLKMIGYATDEESDPQIVDKNFWLDLLHPEDRENAVDTLQDYLEGDLSGEYENYFRLKHKDGSDIWVWSRAVNLKNPDGSPTDILLGTHIDITEIRQKTETIKESELYHRSLIQTIPDTVFVFDKDNNFLDVKYSNEKNLMMEPSQFLGRSVSEIMPYEVAEQQMKAAKQCLVEQEVVSFDYSLQLNGETRYLNARNVAFGEDKVIATVRDITDYQENLNRIKQLLYTQEKQNEKLRNFTHIVSHNLRSHTANMHGILSLLHMEEPEIFSNPYLDLIRTCTENLNETIVNLNEVLDMSFGELDEKTNINLHKTIYKAIISVSTLAQDSGVSLYNEIEENVTIKSYPVYIDSIVLNMLTNGIKFHRADADSYVKVSCNRENSYLAIQFEDNGVGIDLSLHREKLFGMYKTFHEHVESKGLGLFITKNQVEVMGGYIDVESEVNKGTTFTIYLPDEEV